jgi:hypothetical protein
MENRLLYGPAIHEAIATGELERMRETLREAEQYLADHGNVSAAVEALRAEIARCESRGSAS